MLVTPAEPHQISNLSWRSESMAYSKISRICRICGSEFLPSKKNSTLCSHACRDESRRMAVTLTCVECKQPFTRKPWEVRRGRTKFCSRTCSDKHEKPLDKKFWAHVNKTDSCWLWTGILNNKGYGVSRYKMHTYLAHRMSYVMENGPIPDGLIVLHICDVPSCIKPAHLRLGTQKDNMAECAAKDRSCFGERNGHSKLTPESVREMRLEYAEGTTLAELSRKYKVDRMTITSAIRRKTWKRVE